MARTIQCRSRCDRCPRIRRDLPPDVDLLPRVLRGGLPLRLPQRRAADAGARRRQPIVTTVAETLSGVITPIFDGPLPVNIRAWDGSSLTASDPAAPTVVLNSPDALRRIIWARGEIGLSRAYVTGELDVEGDLADAF